MLSFNSSVLYQPKKENTMNKRHLFRLILPAFPPFNIYSGIAQSTTSLGPVCVGTAANKLPNWDIEIIDENNCKDRFCPKDKDGYPDHIKLQEERPADVIGFYGSMTSAIPRLYKVAKLYKEMGITTIAGGYHVRNLPEEALENYIDIVCLNEGENVIRNILTQFENAKLFDFVRGISFKNKNNEMVTTEEVEKQENLDELPFPDFNLVRYAKIKTYPIERSRGCNMNCEFCAVKDKSRCSSAEWMVAQIAHLVETRKAKRFFNVSDHFVASGVNESIKFCKLLKKYQDEKNVSIAMTIQIRINDAKHEELLIAMREAGIYNLAIGIESCIDEELTAMNKGYKEKDILGWLKTYQRHGFFVHGMMIFGYPEKEINRINIPIKERIERFREFITNLDTAQVLLPVPLPGTRLTERLREENRLYEEIGYEYYDGQFLLFEPDEGINPEELQNSAIELMGSFYTPNYLIEVIKAILVFFPSIIFPRVVTLLSFRVRYLVQGFKSWHSKYFRNNAIRFGGSFIVKNWRKYFKQSDFLEKLKEAHNKKTSK